MVYKIERACAAIEDAREAVATTQLAYNRGEVGCDAVNKANDRLTKAHDDLYTLKSGNVPDTR